MALEHLVRSQIAYPRQTGLSEDTQTNTLHWASQTPGDTAADVRAAVVGPLSTFLQTIDVRMDSSMFVSPATIEWFDMDDPTPRVPFALDSVVMTYSAGISLPTEVSMVLSFQAPQVSGINQARRRGRIFLPTFSTTAISETGGLVIWTPAEIAAVEAAFETMMTAVEAAGMYLAIYSDTTFNETGGTIAERLDAATSYAVSGWIDREPDTQRRRGNRSGVKAPLVW